MSLVALLLQILGVLPALIHGAEVVHQAFPGNGTVKKQLVLEGVKPILDAAHQFAGTPDSSQLLPLIGQAVDGYVAIANSIGAFTHDHGGLPQGPALSTRCPSLAKGGVLMEDPHAAVAAQVARVRNLVLAAAERHTVTPALIMAVIHEESGGNPDAFPENPARDGASFGLMQLLLTTARALGFGGPARMLFDPATSIELGSQYLATLLMSYGSEWLALVAYNGGPRAVRLYRLGWRTGPAVHYANTVYALMQYYDRREKVRAARG